MENPLRTLQDSIQDKDCAWCDAEFSTRAATLAHIAEAHPILSRDQRGLVVIERIVQTPYRNERSPRTSTRVLYQGEEVPEAGYSAEWFVRGVEWAVANLQGVTA